MTHAVELPDSDHRPTPRHLPRGDPAQPLPFSPDAQPGSANAPVAHLQCRADLTAEPRSGRTGIRPQDLRWP